MLLTPDPRPSAPLPVDLRGYVRPAKVAATHCKPLARTLYNAQPADIDAHEEAILRRALAAADGVEAVLTERDRIGRARVRPKLDAFIAGWRACADILTAISLLPSERGQRARQMSAWLLPEGLAFAAMDARAAWFDGQRHLQRAARENKVRELGRLVGDDVVSLLGDVTRELGEVIGVGAQPREVARPTALNERVRAFTESIAHYARVLAAKLDAQSPASWARFRSAMGPLDAHRSARARAGRAASAGEPSQQQASSGIATPTHAESASGAAKDAGSEHALASISRSSARNAENAAPTRGAEGPRSG